MIRNELRDKELYTQIAPILAGTGISVIELSEFEKDGRCTVRIVIQSAEHNTTIDDCTAAHKLVFPRLELLRSSRDVYLEVSTPGIQRNIKDISEFPAFIGKDVNILQGDDWVSGQLVSSDEEGVVIESGDGQSKIRFADMKKAKLVYNWKEKR